MPRPLRSHPLEDHRHLGYLSYLHFDETLADLGAEVTSLEGRLRNVNLAKLRWSKIKNLKRILSDLDQDDLSEYGEFDLIINFGLIYHFKNVEEHLKNCSNISKHQMLESFILESKDEKLFLLEEEKT